MLLPKRRIVEADAWSDRSMKADHNGSTTTSIYSLPAEANTNTLVRSANAAFCVRVRGGIGIKDRNVKLLSSFHRNVYRVTGGRIGRRLVNNDMLLLTTVGERSGREHTVPLLYLTNGDSFVVIASYGGRPQHPQWYRNLLTEPEVTVWIEGTQHTVLARTLSEPERAKWWPRIVTAYAGYAEYQERTSRQIPVVELTPVRR